MLQQYTGEHTVSKTGANAFWLLAVHTLLPYVHTISAHLLQIPNRGPKTSAEIFIIIIINYERVLVLSAKIKIRQCVISIRTYANGVGFRRVVRRGTFTNVYNYILVRFRESMG